MEREIQSWTGSGKREEAEAKGKAWEKWELLRAQVQQQEKSFATGSEELTA